MQVLLPSERIKIQLIEVEHNKHKATSSPTSEKDFGKPRIEHNKLRAAEFLAEPQTKQKNVEVEDLNKKLTENLPTLSEQVKEFQNDVLFTKIREYLTNPDYLDRPAVYLRGSRAANGLLYKNNKL